MTRTISAEQFIALLEQKSLLSAGRVARLRREIVESGRRLTAEEIAKRLMEQGCLTSPSARQWVAELLPGVLAQSTEESAASSDGDELELLPLDQYLPMTSKEEPRGPTASSARSEEEDWQLLPRDEGPDLLANLDPQDFDPLAKLFDDLPPAPKLPPLPTSPASSMPGNPPVPPPVTRPPLRPVTVLQGPVDVKPPPGKTTAAGFQKKIRKDDWDSSLLLVGGGALLGLLLLGTFLWWDLRRQGGDQMLAQADHDYLAGSYTHAIQKYGLYLNRYPTHSGTSLARVRRGLAQLRQATEGRSDWRKALDAAHQVLKTIASEEAFKTESQKELLGILPDIAEGLAATARQTNDPELVAQTKESLALIDRYLPKSMQPATRLADIQALLELTEREIARVDELRRSVAQMRMAIQSGKTEEAYRVRNALLKKYPSLLDDQELRAAVLEVARAAQSAVSNMDVRKEPVREEQPSPVSASLILAHTATASAPPGTQGQVACIIADGAAYGLEGPSGKVLWRRSVGYHPNGRSPGFAPVPVTPQSASDVVLVDVSQGHNDVLRVEAATGKLRWRYPVGERFDAHPVVAHDQILVATRSGRLISIDLDSGVSPGYVQLPQGLRVAPHIDLARSVIYQIAEHSNLFVLPLGEPGVKQVVYLGHEAGSITAPPILINRFLIVAENDRAEDAVLKVYAVEGTQKAPAFSLLQEVRLQGHVDTPPLAAGVRLLAVTDQGNLNVFEVSASNPDKPLVPIGEGKAAGETRLDGDRGEARMLRFPLLIEGQVFVADSQLTRYNIQAARGRLHPQGFENEATVALQPLVPLGQSVVHVRRNPKLPGVVVSAMRLGSGKPFWETHLSVPLVGDPIVDSTSGRVTAVTAIGGVFQLDAKDSQRGRLVAQPVAAIPAVEIRQPFTDAVPCHNGWLTLATVNGPRQFWAVNLREPAGKPEQIALADPLGCRAVALAGGLVAPGKLGQVFLLGVPTGVKLAEPFQPRIESGMSIVWREPAVVGQNEFVLADHRKNLYRIGIKPQPKPNLAALTSVRTANPIVSPLAVLGTRVYAVEETKTLSAYALPDLKVAQQWPLAGRCVWGPQRVGDRVLLVIEDGNAADQQRYRLYCLAGDQELLWQTVMPHGPLAGTPLLTGNRYLLASTDGKLWAVDAASGKMLAETDVGEPLATGPVLFGEQLLVGGHDGTLYQIEQP